MYQGNLTNHWGHATDLIRVLEYYTKSKLSVVIPNAGRHYIPHEGHP